MASSTADERAAWRRLHFKLARRDLDRSCRCVGCQEWWPCPTVRLLDEVDRLEAEHRADAQHALDLDREHQAWAASPRRLAAESDRLREQNAKLTAALRTVRASFPTSFVLPEVDAALALVADDQEGET